MARAIEIRLLPVPNWQALRWVLAACSGLITLALYLEGAAWPATVALALAVLGLTHSGEKSVCALRFETPGQDHSVNADRSDRCELEIGRAHV